MSTHETALPEETALAKTPEMESESDCIRSVLRVSGAYLFSCAYRDSLRAAYARHAAENPIVEHELRYRELIASEAVRLVRKQWEEEACAFAATPPLFEAPRVSA